MQYSAYFFFICVILLTLTSNLHFKRSAAYSLLSRNVIYEFRLFNVLKFCFQIVEHILH
jgi:hypothetical protein